MKKHIWATSEDGSIEYISLSSEYVEKALNVLRKSYYIEETCCKNSGLAQNEEAMNEIDSFIIYLAKFGISVIAIEKKTDNVCGVAINQIHQARERSSKETIFAKFVSTVKEEPAKQLLSSYNDADLQFNIFEDFSVDCYAEVLCLASSPDYRRKGIALKLCQVSEEIVKALASGKNVKQPIDNQELTLEPIPKAICAVFSSSKSQSLGKKLDWKIASNNINFDYLENDFILQIKQF